MALAGFFLTALITYSLDLINPGAIAAAAGDAQQAGHRWWQNIFHIQGMGKTGLLFAIVLYLTGFAFIVVELTWLFDRLRARGKAGKEQPSREQTTRAFEMIWALIPGLILLALIFLI
jgi:heme/copper-type cytochrome/quinol oxidase subunit 2